MASETLRADLLNDIREFNKTHNGISRRLYRKHGTYSERQLRNHFGSFGNALREAGILKEPVKEVCNKFVQDSQHVLDQAAKWVSETNEVFGNTWNVTLPKTRISTLEELLSYCKVDTSIWRVERFVVNKYEMGAKDANDNIQVTPLFQVKATLVKNPSIEAARAEINSLKEELKRTAPVPEPIIRPVRQSGNLLELMLPDLHAGKLAWSKETGYQDYDTAIAIETYRRAIDSLLDRAKGYKFDRILLGVGNDILQSDNVQGTTFSGTKVDTDTRFHKTYKLVREMLTETINKLRLIAPVEVKLVPGNHDTLSTFTLGDSLECVFANDPEVSVDNAPILHKIVEWGKVLLMLTHGHLGKQTDYGIWMATEYPEQFGRSRFREIHVGHRHKTALDEKFGVRVRTLSALCPPDNWHSVNGFVGNLRTAEALVFNKEEGLVAQFYHNELD